MLTVKHQGIEYPINHIQSGRRDLEISSAHELNMIVVNKPNNPAYPFLNEEAIVVVRGHEYRIKKLSNKTHYKNFSALHIVMDLAGTPFNQKLSGTFAPGDVFSTLLAGTGWTFNFDAANVVSSIELKEFGRSNVWKLFRDFCNRLQVEFDLLPGRKFDIRKSLSGDFGRQYRYGYNLRNLTKDSISTNLVTHIIVNYGEDLQQTAIFESPSASNYDRPIYGDIINDERIKTNEEAYERAKVKFDDIELSYELDIAELGETYELGETIHTIYEPMDDLSIVTRILKIREEWNGEDFVATSANVGNYVFKTSEEILQDQIKDTESNVNDNIEKTTEVIRKEYKLELSETVTDLERNITTNYTAMISLTARELKTEMTQHVTTINNNLGSMEARFNSSISQTASQIRAEVSSEVTTINNNIYDVRQDVSSLSITASSIQSTVTSHTSSINGLNTQMSSTQSSITQMSDQITQKVSHSDYTGNTIVSKINQDAWSYTIDAQRINLNGAVMVNGSISGATDISINRDIYMGRTLHFSDMTSIGGANGTILLDAYSNIEYQGRHHIFYGDVVDFSRVTVTGLNNSGEISFFQSSNNPKVLVVRKNGSDIGYLSMN